MPDWLSEEEERRERQRRPGVSGWVAAGIAGRLMAGGTRAGETTAGFMSGAGGMLTRGAAALGRGIERVPVVGAMASKAAGVVGAGAAATAVGGIAIALGLAAKAAVKLTNAHIRMTEEFVKARKVYQVGAAYQMGLAPTALGGAQAALATTRAAGTGGIARSVEAMRTRRAERAQATGGGQAGSALLRGLGEGPKAAWEGVKWFARFHREQAGIIVSTLAGVETEDIAAGAEAQRAASFREGVEARRRRLLLEKRFPMLQHEYARGTAMEGMAPGAGAVAIATPANPMHRELMAKIDEAIDSINRLGRLP